ncbi:MAG: putative lipid II flippase FtsW [Candidatus Brocadiaceae bacterium]|nr:putative lipid II flippase FtsW [Candidatus Brocadiaceae bacterium]
MKSCHAIIYVVVALLGFSVVAVYSTDMEMFRVSKKVNDFTTQKDMNGEAYLDDSETVEGDGVVFEKKFLQTNTVKQLAWIGIGALLLGVMAKTDYHHLQRLSIPILIVSSIFLVMVLIPGIGTKVYGARRWIRFGPALGFQPAEFAKLAIIIFLSSYMVKNQSEMGKFKRGFLIPLGIIAVIGLLILKEPDFGTMAFIIFLSLIMLVAGGVRIIFIFFTGISAVPFIHKILFDGGYKYDRLTTFVDPWKDPSGKGYQIIQSWIALGSGGLTGLGIGNSKQKLFYLPESSNDFIFTIIGEEFGFLGVMTIIGLYLLLLWQGLKIVNATREGFGFFLAFGITAMFGLQAAINIGVVSGIIPTTGIPLPFVSTGGSSLLISMIGIGILFNIAKQSEGVETAVSVAETPVKSDNLINKLLPIKIVYKLVSRVAHFSW